MVAFDDVSGNSLWPNLVRQARAEELQYFQSMGVYEVVNKEECLRVTKRPPITTKRIDVNKGDSHVPNYRSRLVAREYKTTDRPELFAATPPAEALNILISDLATRGKAMQLLYADVSRAYFYAKCVRPTYVKFPDEDPRSSDDSLCGRLKRSLYGMRDFPQNWHNEYVSKLIEVGYTRGNTNPCLFHCAVEDIALLVHGGDFCAVGPPAALRRWQGTFSIHYKIKTKTLGPDECDAKEVRVLNRAGQYCRDGLRLEADPRHCELVLREVGVDGKNDATSPGDKEFFKKEQTDVSLELLTPEEATRYRGTVARLNYVCPEKPDLQCLQSLALVNFPAMCSNEWQCKFKTNINSNSID